MTGPEWWRRHGYLAGRPIGNSLWICLAPMLFTFRLMLCTEDAVHEFYCYPNLDDARRAYTTWTGTGDPADGWVKHHPTMRRRTLGAAS